MTAALAAAILLALTPASVGAHHGARCHDRACLKRVQIHKTHPFCNTWACVSRVNRVRARRAERRLRRTPLYGMFVRLSLCESGGNWAINTGNGFYGGLQFTLSSWRAVGGTGMPHLASKDEQISRAIRLLRVQGWGAWPACSSRLGYR